VSNGPRDSYLIKNETFAASTHVIDQRPGQGAVRPRRRPGQGDDLLGQPEQKLI